MHRLQPNDGANRKRHRSSNSDVDQRSRKRRSIADDFECVSDDEGYDYSERADNRWHEGGSTGQYAHNEVMYSANRNFRSMSPEKDKKFIPQPEWKVNPTVTPKGQSYYEHDNRSRDDMTFWERKQMFMKTGHYPSRGFRGGRGGITRGRGRGRGFSQGFVKKTVGAAMDEWKHDKFDEVSTEENESPTKDGKDKKESKGSRKDKKGSKDAKKDKGDKSSRKEKESSSKKDDNSSSRKEKDSRSKMNKEIAKDQETIRQEEESLQQEIKVEVTIGE